MGSKRGSKLIKASKRLGEHTKELEPLFQGDKVFAQNQNASEMLLIEITKSETVKVLS